jgi:hypothetical protein
VKQTNNWSHKLWNFIFECFALHFFPLFFFMFDFHPCTCLCGCLMVFSKQNILNIKYMKF